MAESHGLAEEFAKQGMPLPEALVDGIGEWFAETSKIDTKAVKAGAQASIAGEAREGFLGFRLLAQVKSEVRGSPERRVEVRNALQRYSGDLIDKVNFLGSSWVPGW